MSDEKKSGAEAYRHLDGTPFCMVQMLVLDAATQNVKLTPIHGHAKVFSDRLVVVEADGSQHVVPDSALGSILPSDGTDLLKDAEHYVIVKIADMSQGR